MLQARQAASRRRAPQRLCGARAAGALPDPLAEILLAGPAWRRGGGGAARLLQSGLRAERAVQLKMTAKFTLAFQPSFNARRAKAGVEGRQDGQMSVNVLEVGMIERAKITAGAGDRPAGRAADARRLPPPSTTRWVVRRKAEVVAAVNGGLLTRRRGVPALRLSLEEFACWQRAVDRSGMPGLRVTRIQHYKSLYERQQKF